MKRLLLFLSFIFIFASCHNEQEKEDQRAPASFRPQKLGTLLESNSLYKVKDDTEGVICYVIRGNGDANGVNLQCFKRE